MNMDQYFRNLSAPNRKVDVILDTDAYNEIDDQFAIGYMLKKTENSTYAGSAPLLSQTKRQKMPRKVWRKATTRY